MSLTLAPRKIVDTQPNWDRYWDMQFRARVNANPKTRRAEESLFRFHLQATPVERRRPKSKQPKLSMFHRRQAD